MILWASRIFMTIWLGAVVLLGAFGVTFWHFFWFIPLGTLVYQGFNGEISLSLSEATLRILLYTMIGLSIVFGVLFLIGRLLYWIF